MATLTISPDANPETNSVDGFLQWNGVSGSWATLHDTASNVIARPSNANDNMVFLRCSTTINEWDYMTRAAYLFNASSFNISNAVLRVYITGKGETLAGQSVVVVGITPASNTDLVAADYSRFGTTALSSTVAIASISINAYLEITLNAAGIALINNGPVGLGLRIESDRSNSEPAWSSAQAAYLVGNYAENGTNIPQLVITYSTVSSSGASKKTAHLMTKAG